MERSSGKAMVLNYSMCLRVRETDISVGKSQQRDGYTIGIDEFDYESSSTSVAVNNGARIAFP